MKKNKSVLKSSIAVLAMAMYLFIACSDISHAAETTTDAYEKASVSDMYSNGGFSCSNSSVTLNNDVSNEGVLVSGNCGDVTGATYTFAGTFAFDKSADYLVVDGLAERKKHITLEFYLDDGTTPFAKVSLNRQNRENNWSKVQNVSADISSAGITGSHKISFKVTSGEVDDVKFLIRSIMFVKADIPTVSLDIDESLGSIAAMNGDTAHNTECYGNMTVKVPEGYKSEYTDKDITTETYSLDYIRGRGNSTWGVNKKPYKIKLNEKANLLGMGKNKHWILLANYYDVTMLRNKLTYWLGSELGMEYTPKCEFVNVMMNGQYLGSYYLSEQVRVGKNRVDIDDLSENDETKNATDTSTISGGYLLAMSPDSDTDRQVFYTDQGLSFQIESPDFEDYTNDAQYNYISNYVQKTENAIYGEGFKDSDGVSYSDYMDVDSAIDYYWIQEVSLNGDAFCSTSTYLYKKRDGKLYWGPLWDFDYVAWGATEYTSNQVTGYSLNKTAWYGKLFQDKTFYNKAVKRWPATKAKLLEACKDGGIIDQYSAKQYESQKYNYSVWDKYSDSYSSFWDDGDFQVNEDGSNIVDVTYDSEVTRLKSWIKERVAWIDANLSSLKTQYYTVKYMVGNKLYESVQSQEGREAVLPANPTKKGYIFDGWYGKVKYSGKTYKVQITSNTTVDQNITAYAKWIKATKSNKVTKICMESKDVYMGLGDGMSLNVYTLPFNATLTSLKWKSSNNKIVTVDSYGNVSSVNSLGVATVTATAKNGMKVKCKVHVVDWDDLQEVRAFTVNKKKMTIKKGAYGKVNAQAVPKVTYAGNFVYSSSDESVAKVNSCGYVYGKKKGTAVIAIYNTSLGKMKFCKVKVVAKNVKKAKKVKKSKKA